jgi:hypothetical protein
MLRESEAASCESLCYVLINTAEFLLELGCWSPRGC